MLKNEMQVGSSNIALDYGINQFQRPINPMD